MTCKNCGCDIPENQNICPNCGCDYNDADATYSVQVNKTFSNLLEENAQDNDLYIQSAADNDDEYIKTTEPKHIYPTMCQRGTDEGIPDMDLGRSTRYINRRRKTPAKKTLIEKIVLQFRPSKDASLDEYIGAAEKNRALSIILDIMALIGLICGIQWFINADLRYVIAGLLCPLGTFLALISIDCADTSKTYFHRNFFYLKKEYRILTFIPRALFIIDFFMSAIVIYAVALLMTGLPQAQDKGFIIW